jgi:hypothetical protein
VTDADGDPVTITITGITQDEPTDLGDGGNPCADAAGVGTSVAQLRAERRGGGDGRVYRVSFVGDDGRGGQCEGTVTVCVPPNQKPDTSCVDEGPLFDSVRESCASQCDDLCAIEMVASSICTGEGMPRPLSRLVNESRILLGRAARAGSSKKANHLVASAMRRMQKAARIAVHAEDRGTISVPCGRALEEMFHDAQARLVHSLGTP